jgi:phosphoglycolate phosphatase-like HAD superfamily hydrolase
MGTIAIDGDGVLLDYNAAYATAWQRAFGETPMLTNPNAYWAVDRWSVRKLTGAELAHFRSVLDEDFWSTIPAASGALEACEELAGLGFDLVCVTAMEPRFQSARAQNLRDLGFPIRKVMATAGTVQDRDPIGSPNASPSPQEPHSRHTNLLGFSRWWKNKIGL